MHDLRLISFDLDDTLWAALPVIMAAEAELHAWLSRHFPTLAELHSVESMRAHRRHLRDTRPELGHDIGRLRRYSLDALAREAGLSAQESERLILGAYAIFLRSRHRVTLYPDVDPVLSQLAGDFCLGALTNGNAEVFRLALGRHFQLSLSPVESGWSKPHAAPFQLLLNLAKVEPHQALHIGDDPTCDVDGARRAGLHAVWLNRDGRLWPDHLPPPAHEISDLYSLLDLVNKTGYATK